MISGFVITGVLLRERASTGSTSILHFYGRRVRRILPAATLVIIAAVIASYALLGPISGGQTAGDARWASLFLINVHFRVHWHELSVLATPSLGSAELLVARSRRAVLPDLPHDLPRRCGPLATPGTAPSASASCSALRWSHRSWFPSSRPPAIRPRRTSHRSRGCGNLRSVVSSPSPRPTCAGCRRSSQQCCRGSASD